MMSEEEIKKRDRIINRYEHKVLSTLLQKERKADLVRITKHSRDMWSTTCDLLSTVSKKLRGVLGNTFTRAFKRHL